MNLYLCGPMTGYPRWNFDAFEEAAEALRVAGHDVYSPAEYDLANGFDPDAPVVAFTRGDYEAVLSHDLEVIAHGDIEGLALLPGWEASSGATAEFNLAQALGLPCAPVYALSQMEACS